MAYRRGFKTEANSIATEVRGELNLTALDALDPWALAVHLGIPVWPLSSLEDEAKAAIHHLRDIDQGAFSAVTVLRHEAHDRAQRWTCSWAPGQRRGPRALA